MKVILQQEVPKLGHAGDIKEVSDGFARNFLIPRDLALPATPQTIKAHQVQLKAKAEHETAERKHFEDLAEKLKSTELNFKIKVGEKGQPFGSVSVQDIMEELAKEGIKIEKQWIELEHGIKTTGEHSVKVKFPHQIESEIKIQVEAGA